MEKALLKTRDWSVIDSHACRIVGFTPLAKIESGEVIHLSKGTPYASVALECPKLPQGTTGFITHKLDFVHLWMAFNVRGVQPDEEVIIFWTKKYRKFAVRLFSPFMPRLWVMICRKGAYEYMIGQKTNLRPHETLPIVDWKPEVMD